MSGSFWIWYPGDFELYHGMKQNFSRVERGFGWPAFWKSEGFRNRVVFRRTYELAEKTSFIVYSRSVGYVLAGEKKYPFGAKITCGPGRLSVSVHAGCIEAFPSVYVEGDVICSDKGWMAEDYEHEPLPAGHCKYFTRPEQNPVVWDYSEKVCLPVRTEAVNGGVLFEFETELTAVLEVEFWEGYRPVTICCGESREEALDTVHCYYSWQPDPQTGKCPCSAFRFAFVPDCRKGELILRAIHQYVDIPVKAFFRCGEERMNQIWDVAEHTFRLCSGVFFIDGVKRDKWIWCGDAYQSFFVNRYLLADPDIEQRTLLALRGNDPVTCHINTIVDYSLLWILGVAFHYESYGDREFLEGIYPKMVSLMEFCGGRLDEHGFLAAQDKDWVYIDWADMDKDGPLCAEQMLYAASLRTMAEISEILGKSGTGYRQEFERLKQRIEEFYWDGEKGAYIDSFTSGKRNVTRHANVFAVLFDLADEERQEQIMENVLENDSVPAITTPYFKFYELDVLCKKGKLSEALERIRAYWGGMLDLGAVTFWEEYDPSVPKEEQYDMYGDRFGKSLCHAWAASPIYFLAKYFLGLTLTGAEDGDFLLRPQVEYFSDFTCTLPVGVKGSVSVKWDGKKLDVKAEGCSGVLEFRGKRMKIQGSIA